MASPRRRLRIGAEAWPSTPRLWRPLGWTHRPSAQEAATARVRGEAAAAADEARLAQEAITRKEAEVKALEEALAQERAKKEADERARAEAAAKAQADAARKDTIEAARRKDAEERARTEAELAALEAEMAWPRLPVPGWRLKGEQPLPRPPQWRRRKPSSGARLPREDPEWRPFESSSKGTPPPR